MADTSYAQCGDLSLAYQLFGDGPVELVFAGPFVSHLDLFLAFLGLVFGVPSALPRLFFRNEDTSRRRAS